MGCRVVRAERRAEQVGERCFIAGCQGGRVAQEVKELEVRVRITRVEVGWKQAAGLGRGRRGAASAPLPAAHAFGPAAWGTRVTREPPAGQKWPSHVLLPPEISP